MAAHEQTARACVVSTHPGRLFIIGYLSIPPGKDLLGRKACQSTVMVLVVVPGEVMLTPRMGMGMAMGEMVEDLGIFKLILLGLELCLGKRIVVAHPRP